MTKRLEIPVSIDDIRSLCVGDSVLLSGIMVTGRDAVHKWIYDTFIQKTRIATDAEGETIRQIKKHASGGFIYHCGPVVTGSETKEYRFVAAGPTTSIREEPYQAAVMEYLNLRGVIGKGGMGTRTIEACQDQAAVYFHAIGGAGAVIASTVTKVLNVYKLEFGIPEAAWVIEVKDFPAIVTIDAHGASLHEKIRSRSKTIRDRLIE